MIFSFCLIKILVENQLLLRAKVDFSKYSTNEIREIFYNNVNDYSMWCDFETKKQQYEYTSEFGIELINRYKYEIDLLFTEKYKKLYVEAFLVPTTEAFVELIALYIGTHQKCN